MNSIKGGHFVSISGVYKQHPAPRLDTECQTGAPSSLRIVTKANGVYMHYSSVNKTGKNVHNVYTYQIISPSSLLPTYSANTYETCN